MNWKRLIAKYIDELRDAGFSDGTLSVRAMWLKKFLLWCNEQGVRSAPEVTAEHLELYRQFLHCSPAKRARFLSLRTVYQGLCVLRQFFHWATERGHLLFSPAAHLKLPRIEVRLTEVPEADVQRLMDAALNNGSLLGLRDRAICEMFYRAGIRRKELAQIKLADVDLQQRTLRTKNRGKERSVPLDDVLAHALERYIQDCRPQLAGSVAIDALFISSRSTPYTTFCLSEMLKRFNQRAGLHITTHMLKHACAVHLLAGGAEFDEVQRRLGNISHGSVTCYLNAATAALQRQPRRTQTQRRLTHFYSLIEEPDA
jgi:integrase/recombinase XerD